MPTDRSPFSAFRSARLGDVAEWLPGAVVSGHPDQQVRGIALRETEVHAGWLYAAVNGSSFDGQEFIDEAFARGAIGVVTELERDLVNRAGLLVDNARRATGVIASRLCGTPSDAMAVAAVTGTNGKTSVHWLLSELMTATGVSAMRIGTFGVDIGALHVETGLTTPDAVTLQRAFALGGEFGIGVACIEASSHALDQERLAGTELDVAIFTNLTRDHLDYHHTMARYFRAKASLFDLLKASSKPGATAILNADDQYGLLLREELRDSRIRVKTFGMSDTADIRILRFSQDLKGLTLTIEFEECSYTLRSAMIGLHNAMNLAATFAAANALGVPPDLAAEQLANVSWPSGRLERVDAPDVAVFVDYAHTPDAIGNVLTAVRPITRPGALWAIVGCGGDRDQGKRGPMLRAAIDKADRVVVTSDNPRGEDPIKIISEMLAAGSPYKVQPDRRAAIMETIREMDAGDVLVICGKGHETYQIVGPDVLQFSDADEARRAVARRQGLR